MSVYANRPLHTRTCIECRETKTHKNWLRGPTCQTCYIKAWKRGKGIEPPELVPVSVVQSAFADAHITSSELARRLGWLYRDGPDTARVRRQLGLIPEQGRRGRTTQRKRVRATRAAELIQAMGLAPVDYDL